MDAAFGGRLKRISLKLARPKSQIAKKNIESTGNSGRKEQVSSLFHNPNLAPN
jgi:hypothetical protein